MSSNQSPFSIRSITAPDDRKPKNVAEFIQRVNATHPGGFRALNVTDVKKKIEEQKQKQNAALDNADVVMEDGAGSDQEASAEAAKDLATARMEVLRNINAAWMQANNAQQMVSLLMSKEAPTQVMGTLDPELRNLVGIGSLGSTRLHDPPFFEERLQENKVISTGARLQAINNTANKLLAAATRLQKEMTVETEYWQEVLSIKEGGWPVSRLPNNPLTVAVKFGFSDSSADFQANSWAALSREDDGSVNLEMPRLISEPKQLVVSVEKNGKVVGKSSLAQPIAHDAPLELRVREARNTILAQELWHEINREGRSLLAYKVQLLPSSVKYQVDNGTTVNFTLATLGELLELDGGQDSKSEDRYAETICASLYLLLAHSHRQNARKRIQIQTLTADKARQIKPAYTLLKPVIAYMQHEKWLRSSVEFVSNLTATLRLAGVEAARFELEETPLPPITPENASEQLLNSILGSTANYRIHLTITPQVRLVMMGITGGTNARPSSVIRFLPPVHRSQKDPHVDAPNLLGAIYLPADIYDSLRDAFEYLQGATTRALAKHFEILAAEWMGSAKTAGVLPDGVSGWAVDIKGNAIRDRDTERRGVTFQLLGDDGTQASLGQAIGHLSTTVPSVTGMRLTGDQLDTQGGIQHQEWSWELDDIAQGNAEPKEKMQDIVQRVLMTAA
ncbi:subunit 17 of mediator complex-domain-containing protein [Coniochaeta sp. 2T2.1]|nr:subunit 17 of mediator complex-domain-containing protein [Coniochaeta sp. 2T2.1]